MDDTASSKFKDQGSDCSVSVRASFQLTDHFLDT